MVTLFGWVPYLGTSLKVMYVGKLTNNALKKVQMPAGAAIGEATELNAALKDISATLYDEVLAPEVDKLGLPSMLTDKAKNKAIDLFAKELAKKYASRVSA
jgi:hypothetical protein